MKKILGFVRGYLLRRRATITGRIKVYGKVKIKNPVGRITIGPRVTLHPNVVFDFEAAPPGTIPEVSIGERTIIGDRTEIHCGQQVIIGKHVGISWDVILLESDYHAIGGGKGVPKPIIIEDGVWIGMRCIILKGVTIGKNSVIGTGSVVTKSIPANVLAAGNPAKVIRMIEGAPVV